MPPEFKVEPLQSIADDPAVRNDHLNTIILTCDDGGAAASPCASDWRQQTPCPCAPDMRRHGPCLATPFPLNLKQTDRDRDRVDNRTPPPLCVRR